MNAINPNSPRAAAIRRAKRERERKAAMREYLNSDRRRVLTILAECDGFRARIVRGEETETLGILFNGILSVHAPTIEEAVDKLERVFEAHATRQRVEAESAEASA
jgi:hypothetical protein